MTHSRTRKRQQHGGMKFGYALKRYLMSQDLELNDENIIRLLMSIVDVSRVRIVWDASTYSFIFELTLRPGITLLDPFGTSLAQSADTFVAHASAAAGAPEHGTPVSNFCAKISFVHDGSRRLGNEYNGVQKRTVTSVKANREANTQRRIFELFACLSTKAPFTSDVLAHAILSGEQFRAIFGNVLTSTVASTTPGVLGTPKKIYDWIRDWYRSDGIGVDVLLMEMLDFQRTAPGVPRSMRFRMIHSLSGTPSYGVAALRMAAEIAVVGGKEIVPHDFHGGNGLAIPNGLQLYLVDWGGLFDLANREDRATLLDIFKKMCDRAHTTELEESDHALQLARKTSDPTQKLLARFPCLQDLCGFFEIPFIVPQVDDDDAARNENIKMLKAKFEEELTTGFVDFVCVAPTPQNVHHTLTLVAFIDFMSNLMVRVHPYCQCGDVLGIVYPKQVNTFASTTEIDVTTFRDFRTFLRQFKVKTLPPSTELDKVVGLIQEIVAPCPSACVALSPQMLRPTWMETKRREIMLAQKQAEKEEAMRFVEREKAIRLAEAEARRLAEEKARVEREAEAKRVAKREAEAKRVAKREADAIKLAEAKIIAEERKRASKERTSKSSKVSKAAIEGIKKPETLSKPEHKQAFQKAASAHASASAAAAPAILAAPAPAILAAPAPSAADVAVPTSWLSRLSSKLNPKSWSWFKKQGGTRKQRKQRKSFTKRRHN